MLTEGQIQDCTEERGMKEVIGEYLFLVDQVDTAVEMDMNEEVAEDRVWYLRKENASVLRSAGYGNILKKNSIWP